jgi:uncharacterized protein YrzB (UPF0473 family)
MDELLNPVNDGNDTVTLYDEDGNATEFAIIDGVEYNGNLYLALVEQDQIDAEECEFLILKKDKNDPDLLVTIDNEEEFTAVMEVFDEKLDEYDLTDESAEEDAE